MRPQVQPGFHFQGFGFKRMTQWGPTAAVWGGVAGLAVLYMAEKIPMIRRDILSNIPVVGGHWRQLVEQAEAEGQ
ncbi:ubiquinol-cytochrome-c reductase complex subunit-domain-containing protein [Catenaria anguillulae PL171]|uniref:Ubiquinol-cytochrome-c reductase complex subunit-domain-containing protein n=1 Tax=Catenaria anguillulae PL171 TaxID=765915 RepID=A0A1Y2I3U8_9FUNG|nr:ubiquinol-cytochrome-c reductase complex subunit-domain-containing protein [Catenaria anguillulae PL171]